MIHWSEYQFHEIHAIGERNKVDNNIYTFDIETTSYIVLHGKQLSPELYLDLSDKEQKECKFYATMYIWQFGINDTIFYGRTYDELYEFLKRIEENTNSQKIKKICVVHNLSFEFQFMRNIFKFKNVMARKSRKIMKCQLEDFNFEFRCSLYMTNAKLEKLPNLYKLDVKKLVGNLDYTKARHFSSRLKKSELDYCENDCLVVYQYIRRELENYITCKNVPLTSTGHVRRELKELVSKNYKYKNKVRRSINTDGHIYNLLVERIYADGYTHANWLFSSTIMKNVSSFDFCSSYPYVMVTNKFPMSEFKRCNIKDASQMLENFAYLLVIKMTNVKSKYYNNFISQSKCRYLKKAKFDNGRIIGADELEIVLTDVDFKFLLQAYDFEYEILESYFARYDYLPKEFINFILDKYYIKTTYKNVSGKELEYNLEKAKFNSLYGMTVTNNIKDEVIFDNETGWREEEQTNEKILKLLQKEKKEGFLSFSWGVWITRICKNES